MADLRKRLGDVKRRVQSSTDSPVDEGAEDQVEALRKRVVALEREVQENRELNRRVAELTDVVTELLIPIADRDDDKVSAVLDKYRREL